MFILSDISTFQAVCGLFAIGFLGALFGGIASIAGSFISKSKKASSSQANFAVQLKKQQEQYNRQLDQQAEQNKKSLMLVGGGALALVGAVLFMKK